MSECTGCTANAAHAVHAAHATLTNRDLLSQICNWHTTNLDLLIRHNRVDGVRYMMANNILLDKTDIETAIAGGNMDIIRLVCGKIKIENQSNQLDPQRHTIRWSICGQKVGLNWVEGRSVYVSCRHDYKECCTEWALDWAALHGHLHVVKWLHNKGAAASTNAMDWAALRGHLHVIKWLHENRTEGCTKQAMEGAIYQGYIDVVAWLYHNKPEARSPRAVDLAVKLGEIHIVQWLHANSGYAAKALLETAYTASMFGRLEIVQWVYTNYRLSTRVALGLAKVHGHWDVAEWLTENYYDSDNEDENSSDLTI